MYIKRAKKQNPGKTKIYEYLHLVENVRTEKGPRQRLILNLGAIDVPPEKYKELANCIEAMLSGQQSLFSQDPTIESYARDAVRDIVKKRAEEQAVAATFDDKTDPRPDYQHIDAASIAIAEPRSLGPEYVCHSIWKELGIDDLLLSKGVSPHSLSIIETLVLGRLICPASERQTWQWAQHRSAVYELAGTPLKGSLNSFYRATDTVFLHKDAIEAHLSKKEKEIFALPETLCLFDLTNTHFEGRALGNPKARFGRSKQKRSDCKLLTLALIVDDLGFVKNSHLYPGNQQETKTLAEMIESLVALRPDLASNRTVIMDAGIVTEENLAWLRRNRFHYIVVKRGRSDFTPEDTAEMKVIRKAETFTIEVKRKEKEIWQTYMMLTRIERAFRSLKSSLGLRPNFHQIERRADAHLFISVLAYHVLHIIEHRLRQQGDHRCWQTICQQLSTHQRLTVEYDVKERQEIRRCHLRICSRPEPEQSMIYNRLGLSGTPLGRQMYKAK